MPLVIASKLFAQIETLLEPIDASAGVNQLLLAGKEGMAIAADFHADVLLGGADLELVAAGTLDGGHLILGMNTLFHFFSPRKAYFSHNPYYHKKYNNASVFFKIYAGFFRFFNCKLLKTLKSAAAAPVPGKYLKSPNWKVWGNAYVSLPSG